MYSSGKVSLKTRKVSIETCRMVCPEGTPPATTLRLTSLRQITCSNAGRAEHSPAKPSGLFCAAILLCDLSRSAAHAFAPRRTYVSVAGPLLTSTRRTIFIPKATHLILKNDGQDEDYCLYISSGFFFSFVLYKTNPQADHHE